MSTPAQHPPPTFHRPTRLAALTCLLCWAALFPLAFATVFIMDIWLNLLLALLR